MASKLGVLFLHYHIDEVVRNNLASVRRENPEAVVATISTNRETFPNGYSVDDTPEIKKLHSIHPYFSSDWLICSWVAQRREKCEKWWIVEWDVYCRMSVRDYYKPVWHFPFVASSVKLRYRDPDWHWFGDMSKVPKEYRPYAMGASPVIYLMEDEALTATCQEMLRKPFDTICEFRFATMANACGYPPCGYSPPPDGITWLPWTRLPPDKRIFHPVKFLVHDRPRTVRTRDGRRRTGSGSAI
jgi:hypothetical protein